MSRRDRGRLELAGVLLVAIAAAGVPEDRAIASPLELAQAGGGGFDANIAALIVAVGTLAAGVVGYLRLRTERPKIVAEVAALHEERLRDALDDAWKEAERLRQARDTYRSELDLALRRIDELERREDELEAQIAELRRSA